MERRDFIRQMTVAGTALSAPVVFANEALAACTDPAIARCMPFKWVFTSALFASEDELAVLKKRLDDAKALGLNGMTVLSYVWDRLDRLAVTDTIRVDRIKRFKDYADETGMEIIPLGYSVGYASAIVSRNVNWLEGQFVDRAVFQVSGGIARHVPNPEVRLANPTFEAGPTGTNAIPGWFADCYGTRTVLDAANRYQPAPGNSVCFGNFTATATGCAANKLARISQVVNLVRDRTWRLTFRLKAAGFNGNFNAQVYRLDGSMIASFDCGLPASGTCEWTSFTFTFPSLDQDQVRIWLRCSDGDQGNVWVDGLEFGEAPPLHILNRAGCPVTVRMIEPQDVPLVVDVDYAPFKDPKIGTPAFSYERAPAEIPVLQMKGSKVPEGAKLQVSYYQYVAPHQGKSIGNGAATYSGQSVACMSAMEVYDAWGKAMRVLNELKPKRLLMTWDEIRSLHACRTCTEMGDDPGELIAEAVIRFAKLAQECLPDTELLIWSDMLNPKHNARTGKYYHLSRRPFATEPAKLLLEATRTLGADGLPRLKRLPTIMCWWGSPVEDTVKYFGDLGFPVMAATYYDAASPNTDNTCSWLKALQPYPQAKGMMYTTWKANYSQLPFFAGTYPAGCP